MAGARGRVAAKLSGWSKARRVVVLRRPLKSKPAAEEETEGKKKSK